MWELIESNKRKSLLLFACMGICLLVLGYVIGRSLLAPRGGAVGVVVALCVWLLLSLVSYFSGDAILLAISGAREVTHDIHPQLFNIVEEMKIAANLPAMPRVYIIDERAPNAFATGKRPERSAIAVTAGLLSRLSRDELQGVIAHEMSHIANRDVLFMTFAGVMMGSIVLISDGFLRGMLYSSRSSRRFRAGGKGGGQSQGILMIVAIIFAILAPLMARLLYFAISRKREYLADASATRLTRYPEGLASALEKISSEACGLSSVNRVTAPMYIVNPLQAEGMGLSGLTSTHPPIRERIQILRSIAHGAGYASYQEAFSRVSGRSGTLIPPSGLTEEANPAIREASLQKEERGKKAQARDVGDLMRAVNRYAFLICACGLKMKIPPDFKRPQVSCPRCRRAMDVPLATLSAAAAAVGASSRGRAVSGAAQEAGLGVPPIHVRKGTGWETLSCACGRMLQLSPMFSGLHIVCSSCGRKTEIKH